MIGDVIERHDAALLVRCDDESASTELEVEQRLERAIGLGHEIPTRDTSVSRPIGNELGDILRANEERLELAAERGGERAVAEGAHAEAGLGEESARFVGQTTLVWESDSEHNKKARPVDGPWLLRLEVLGALAHHPLTHQNAPTRRAVAMLRVMMVPVRCLHDQLENLVICE